MPGEIDARGEPSAAVTLTETTAYNIRRLREQSRFSRSQLASELTEATGTEWKAARIVDLEGARSTRPGPADVRWPEIVALAAVFGVPMFELVLPPEELNGRTLRVVLSSRSDTTIVERERLGPLERRVGSRTLANRDDLAKLLFWLPAELLETDRLERSAETYPYVRDISQIIERLETGQERFERALETFARATGDEHDRETTERGER